VVQLEATQFRYGPTSLNGQDSEYNQSSEKLMNKRHKAIIFATLVATGSALLAGVELKTALGMIMLGAAFAWVAGSKAVLSGYARFKEVTSNFYVWVRLPIVMAFAGGVLGVVLELSHANPVAAIGTMSIVGIFLAPLTALPHRQPWLKVLMVAVSPPVFLLAAYGALLLNKSSLDEHGGKLGAMSLTGFIALLFGIWWLSKGWRLIQLGLGMYPAETVAAPEAFLNKGTGGSYISLFVGVIVLTFLIGLMTWTASSDWSANPWQLIERGASNNVVSSWSQAGFILLIGWWPYSQWKRILFREPHSFPLNLRRHKRITVSVAMFFTVVLCLAATFGIQNGTDRILTREIDDSNASLRDVIKRISDIKERRLETTQDYIEAYSVLDTLQPEFESKIQYAADLYQNAQQLNGARGPVNIQRFYSDNTPEVWKAYLEVVDILRRVNDLTKEEVGVAKTMATLPPQDQPSYWQTHFKPLLEQEGTLREKMIEIQDRGRTKFGSSKNLP